jgi:thiosulfate/3-mercaptopyruvate sulfurtransferase
MGFFSTIKRVVCVFGLFFGLVANANDVVPIDARGYVNNDLLVSVDWLKEHFEDENLLILDARADGDYKQKHIRGAVLASWKEFAKMDAPMGDGFATLLEPADLTKVFQEKGIDESKFIVVYSDPNGWGEDGRIAWMLKMAGLKNVRILDGGWPAWKDAKGATSRVKITPKPTSFVVTELDESLLATTEDIAKNLENYVLIDTRALDEWKGATKYGEKRGGHIKGALHLEWSNFFNEDKTIKSQAQIEKIMNDLGVSKDDVIVPYCTAGIRSAHMSLVLRMAGYKNAKNYAASIYEWSAIKDLPMEK